MFRKLNTSTDMKFLMPLKGNSFKNKNNKRRITFFTKNSEICIFCAIYFDQDGLTS